jgi:hypothetical protein
MLGGLNGFLAARVPIDALISDLEGLLNALQEADKEWKQRFLHFWGMIEDERATALFREMDALDVEATQRVEDAVNHLKRMVLEKLQDPNDVQESIKDNDGHA